MLASQARLTISVGAGGTDQYGTLSSADATSQHERVCAWLMDPIACPTTWPTLIRIRGENPHYGTNVPAAA